MDKIDKLLLKILPIERKKIIQALTSIKSGSYNGLDITKLKSRKDIFRVRIGKYRIIFQVVEQQEKILAVEKRSDTTYNF